MSPDTFRAPARLARDPLIPAPFPIVEREGIRWEPASEGGVRILIDVRNPGAQRTDPTTLEVQSAPFGAFLPWTPLASLRVPAIQPGGTVVLETVVPRPSAPRAEEWSGGTRPLLTATADDDEPRPRWEMNWVDMFPTRAREFENLRRMAPPRRPGALAPPLAGALAADILESQGQNGTYWAGNLNVLLRNRAVERHMSGPLRILPGRTNVTQFCMGAGDYQFRFEGSGAAWPIRSHDPIERIRRHLRRMGEEQRAGFERFFERFSRRRGGMRSVQLEIDVPSDVVSGELEVHVRRLNDDARAVVEFSLDARAAGPGCYVA